MSSIEKRNHLFELNKERLEHFAVRILERGQSLGEFYIVCIDVDDPSWTEVVEALMPNHNWQVIRDRGEKPVARGTAYVQGLKNYLTRTVPDIETGLTGPIPEGTIRVLVMAEGGVNVHLIDTSQI